ncbi:ABC transporter substrate-binding protein [Paraburkholderia sp. BL9I2N2]|uniref:ABC transporter substrate-binding protein n=1 Tax=Paraburkholderia sp. BL9I2N2 TaxID=1938809 RepID=UPI001042B2CB|nr:ABC transporter substrate-binding protein [Paraburkholderia sp. BL9I2N2]TCK84331.1 monosaccharide ABC transporter substrate-binding protein (CUT2 family) [Paraburkholderia sp. BL9I2N2]
MKPGDTAIAAALLAALALASAASPAHADETASTARDGIALSNSYTGNGWRQQMLKMWDLTSKDAIRRGVIARTKVVNADNSAPQQASQIGDLTLQGWQAIVIDAASPTALNGVIQQACSAHIVVVVFDSLTTAPCAYKVAYNYVDLGLIQAAYIAKRLGGKGNVVEVRGLAGTSVDNDIHEGVVEGFAKYPNIKLLASVNANWTQSVAQKEIAGILPTLPKIDAVVTQAGAGYGAYQAFRAAGRPTPLIIMGDTEEELRLWKQLASEPGGYETISLSSPPGVSSIAFWVAQQVLAGTKVPQTVNLPLLVITSKDLDAWLKVVPPGGAATPLYSQDWTGTLIEANITRRAPPPSPIPTSIP